MSLIFRTGLAALAFMAFMPTANAQERDLRSKIVLEGNAEGGAFSVALINQHNQRKFTVETHAGQGLADIAAELADVMESQLNVGQSPIPFVLVEGSTIHAALGPQLPVGPQFPPGETLFVMGSTDPGIKISPAPRDLSAFHDPERDGHVFSWSLPVDSDGATVQYDQLFVAIGGPIATVPLMIGATNESYFSKDARLRYSTLNPDRNDSSFAILWGVIAGIPSPPAIVIVEPGQIGMSEEASSLYHQGVMPNWWVWHETTTDHVQAYEMHHEREPSPAPPHIAEAFPSPNYQGIVVPEGTGGIARGVLTELDGVYRPFIQLRIPSELQEESGWEVSVSATPIAKEDRDLLPRWNKSGKIDASLNRPFAVYNASSTQKYDEWVGVTPVSPLTLNAEESAGFLVTVSARGTGDHMIGIDGFTVHHNAIVD